jgi:hypothetical protein
MKNTAAKTSRAPRVVTEQDIQVAKMILREWGSYEGEITEQGLHALASAVRTLRQARARKQAGKKARGK